VRKNIRLWSDKIRGRIVSLVILADLFVLAVILMSLAGSLALYRERAETTSRNLNHQVSLTISGEISAIDLMLQTEAEEISYRHLLTAGGTALHDALARQQQRHPVADAIRVADAQGHMLAASDDIPDNISLADRGFFQSLKANPGQGMIISPALTSRITNQPVLIFVRALTDQSGNFAGIITAPVAMEWFRSRFRDMEVGEHGVVVMRGNASRDFDLLARYPSEGYVIGQTKVSETFRAQIAADPRSGSYEAHAGADNVDRVFSYQAVGNYPLITLVGMAREDFMGSWRREAVKLAILGLSFLLVTGVGAFFLARTWRTLEQRTAELERSNADLEQFAYAASHDLQTPLRNIASYTQLLERRYRGQLGDEAEQFLDFIVGNAKRLSMMIRDLLDFSRANTAGYGMSAVDLAQVVSEVLGRLRQDLEQVGASVIVGDLPTVRGEVFWLDSLVQNLLENAIRYRHPERPLTLSIEAKQESGHRWRVCVADNGIGIDPAYHDKIFNMFYRLNPQSYPDGTGIGLPLCRRLISRFGGRLWVESESGQGARFFFTLIEAEETIPANSGTGANAVNE